MVTVTKLWLEDIGSGGKATADNCRFSFSRHFHFLKIKRKMQIIESISLFIFDWIEEKNNILHSFNLLMLMLKFCSTGREMFSLWAKIRLKIYPTPDLYGNVIQKNFEYPFSNLHPFLVRIKTYLHILNLGLSGSVGCQYFWFTPSPQKRAKQFPRVNDWLYKMAWEKKHFKN